LCQLTTHIEEVNYEDTINRLNDLQLDYLNPEGVNTAIADDFSNMPQYKHTFKRLQQFFKGLMILNLLPPYLVWKFLAQPKIKELEFTATFRFAIAITLVPIYLLIITIALAVLFSLKLALIYLLLIVIISLLSTKL
jgi:hypothetical protein